MANTGRTAPDKTQDDEAQTVTPAPPAEEITVPFKPSDVGKMIRVEVAKARANLEAQLRSMIPVIPEMPPLPDAPDLEKHTEPIRQAVADLGMVVASLAGGHDGLESRMADLEAEWGKDVQPGVEDVETPPAAPPPVGLGAHRKVLALMRAVDVIAKGRTGKTGQGGREEYAFRGVDDAMNAVGRAQRDVGLLIQPTVLRQDFESVQVPRFYQGKQEGVQLVSITRVHMRYTFVDPDDGSTFPIEMVGSARDYGDKDTSKAVSAAMKYALFQGLNIPVEGVHEPEGTGMDPERDNPRVEYRASGQSGAERAQADWDATGRPEPRPEPIMPAEQETDAQRAAREAFEARRRAAQGAPDVPATPPPAEAEGSRRPDPEESPDQRKQRRAHQALAAGRKADGLAQLNAIVGQVRQEGLSEVMIDGQKLSAHLVGLAQLLPDVRRVGPPEGEPA